MNKTYFLWALSIVAVIAVTSTFQLISAAPIAGEGLEYHSAVCVSVNDGEPECSPNVLTDIGKNHIRDYLGAAGAGTAAMDWIALGNGSAPVAGSTSLTDEQVAYGLSRTQGTYVVVGTGNWSVMNTFTATGAVGDINSTALFNATWDANVTMLAGNTFTQVDLQQNDQINVTWTIWVT